MRRSLQLLLLSSKPLQCPACLGPISARASPQSIGLCTTQRIRLFSTTQRERQQSTASTATTTTKAAPAKAPFTRPATASTFSKPTVATASTTASTPKPLPPQKAPTTTTTGQAKVPIQPSRLTDPSNIHDLSSGLLDPLPEFSTPTSSSPQTSSSPTESHVDWSRSFHGLSGEAFSQEAANILLEPINPEDVEIKPEGIVYLPEIKYRRILNRAFGPGAWGLAPRGETIVTAKSVTREYGLVVHGRLVSISRGEQQYFDPEGIPTATEGCKSNALMRCCKDLGIASELWDPVFIRKFMAEHSKQVWVEHQTTKKRKLIVMRKDVKGPSYPFKEVKGPVGI